MPKTKTAGMSELYPPKLRARIFQYYTDNDSNYSKTARHFNLPRSSVTALIKRFPEEIKDCKEATQNAAMEQAIEMRQEFLDLLQFACREALKDIQTRPDRHRVRLLDVAKSMEILGRMVAGGDDDERQKANNNPEDEGKVSRAVDRLISESTEDAEA
jgi:transposase-like protein